MSNEPLVVEVAQGMHSLASAAELLGQERAIGAVMDHLIVRGIEKDELAVFERAIRERLKYT